MLYGSYITRTKVAWAALARVPLQLGILTPAEWSVRIGLITLKFPHVTTLYECSASCDFLNLVGIFCFRQ